MVSGRDCATRQGFYRGNGTACAETTCTPPATGACCLRDPAGAVRCVVLTEERCTAAQGNYRGNGTTCAAGTCE